MLSKPIRQSLFGQTEELGTVEAADAREILELLGDEMACRLLDATADPKTVPELIDETGLSQSTTYRKVRALEAAGLLEAVNPDAPSGVHTRYRRAVSDLTVRLSGQFRVELHA